MRRKAQAATLIMALAAPAFAQDMNRTEGILPQPRKAETREERKIHAGANIGVNSPEGSYGSTPNIGVDVGYQPWIPYGVGAELFTSNINPDSGTSNQRTALLGRGTYNFGGELPVLRHSYAGLGLGPVLTGSTWEVGVAPQLGFDIPLELATERDLSVGFHLKYLVTTSPTPDALLTNFAMKYWF